MKTPPGDRPPITKSDDRPIHNISGDPPVGQTEIGLGLTHGQVGHPQIQPHRLYSVREVAQLINLHEDTVYRIPEAVLPRVRIGPRGGRTRIRGLDLSRYIDGED